jgi:hypothetical protein
MAESPNLDPMNPFESVKRHDLSKPQSANPAGLVYPWILAQAGRWIWLLLLVALVGLASVVLWAFTASP